MSNNIIIEEDKQNNINFKSFVDQLTDLDFSIINKEKIDQLKSILNQIFKYLIKINFKRYPSLKEYLDELLKTMFNLIAKNKKDISFCILEEIYFLFSNLKSEEILKYFYSSKFRINKEGLKMNIFDILIFIGFQENSEEFLNTQVNFMKSLILKINDKTISYFYDKDINHFPILNKSLALYDYSEDMIRGAVRNILLLITKIKEKSLICYLTSFPVALYYPNIIYKFKSTISSLNFMELDKYSNIYEYLEEKHEELYDTILYINDILLCKIKNINFVLINCLLNEIIFPLLNIIISKRKEKISIHHSIYILALFIFYLKNEFIIDLISFFLFKEEIPLQLLEQIKKYQYKDNNAQFMTDINYLIKHINNADINDNEWKRNAEFIKKDIGLDLYTGVIEKDNNFHYFSKCLKEKNNQKNVKNEIFENIKELLTSKDDNIIINVSLLLFNDIFYYYNYFKNYKGTNEFGAYEEFENDENSGKNKIRNFELDNNNLNDLSRNNINNNKNKLKNDIKYNFLNDKAIFNPFLLSFFNIFKLKNNNKISLFELLIKLLKGENNNRIFTNEIILNIIILLNNIYLSKEKISSEEYNYLYSNLADILKDKINKIKLLTKNNEIKNYSYSTTIFANSYLKSDSFDSKIQDLMKLYYLLIPSVYLEENEKIPFPLKQNKTKLDSLNNNLISTLLILEVIQSIVSKYNKNKLNAINMNNKNFPFEIEKDIDLKEGKTYKKEEIGKEYGFCFIGESIENFHNLRDIKKCLVIISKYDFYLGEIESNTFKDLSKIKIFYKVKLRFLNIQVPLTESDSFLEINETQHEDKNNKKLIMNCFDPQNTKKMHNFLWQMISNCIIFENSIFDSFLENIENIYLYK